MSAVTFLALNGVLLRVGCDQEIYCAMIDIAKKRLTREGLAALLESLAEAHWAATLLCPIRASSTAPW